MTALAADYLESILAHLPHGKLWDDLRLPGSGVYEILAAVAEEYARLDARADQLRNELDPRYTNELLADWEAYADLPDPCAAGINTTLQERRLALVSKLTFTGGQSRAFYLALATAMGYSITITEYQPFVCGISQCGIDQLWSYGHAIRHHWSVTVLGPRVTYFRCGESECGIDPITKWVEATDLECRFKRLNEAHRNLHFIYTP
ncbi:YmfQ family protein [Methylomonas sp. 11b]|uniref:YmfQ family protein n=1 Tax=Methylomonas sp. 11b TaxID=1168169 RepID=UPI00047C1FBC|nr:putative phage tail protein [Methylomonas sp. 11b]